MKAVCLAVSFITSNSIRFGRPVNSLLPNSLGNWRELKFEKNTYVIQVIDWLEIF